MSSASLHLPRCCETSERLSEFLDDELDENARHEVALHLAACEACAQLAVELAATVHALHELRSCPDPERDHRAR
jgi:anti-sigma factor RsiW